MYILICKQLQGTRENWKKNVQDLIGIDIKHNTIYKIDN